MVPNLEERLGWGKYALRCIKGSLQTLIFSTLMFSSNVYANTNSSEPQRQPNSNSITNVKNAEHNLMLGVEYSWTDMSNNETENIRVRSHRLGITMDLPIYYFNLHVASGAQKLHINYSNPKYMTEIRDLELELDGSAIPYLGLEISGSVPIRDFSLGAYLYGEISYPGDVEIEKLKANLNLPADFDIKSIASMKYKTSRADAGLLFGFRTGGFRLDAAIGYFKISLDFDVNYTKMGMDLVESLAPSHRNIRDGNFDNSTDGGYIQFKPSYRLGSFVIGLDGDLMLVDSLAYRVGTSVGFLIPW